MVHDEKIMACEEYNQDDFFLACLAKRSRSLRSPLCLTSRNSFIFWDWGKSLILWQRMSSRQLESEGRATLGYSSGQTGTPLLITCPLMRISWNQMPLMSASLPSTSFLDSPAYFRRLPWLLISLMNSAFTRKIPPIRSAGVSFSSPCSYSPFFAFQMLISANRFDFFSRMNPFPQARKDRFPKINPEISHGGKQHWKWLPLRKMIWVTPSLPPTAELMLTSAKATSFPCMVNQGQVMQKALMGGWWLICSQQMGMPLMQAWKVSPRMGLKGFCMSSSRVGMVAKRVKTFLIWVRGSASATGIRQSGADPKAQALLSSSDLDSKMSTGMETLRQDFPVMRLAPICLMMNLRLSFWPLSTSQLMQMSSLSLLILYSVPFFIISDKMQGGVQMSYLLRMLWSNLQDKQHRSCSLFSTSSMQSLVGLKMGLQGFSFMNWHLLSSFSSRTGFSSRVSFVFAFSPSFYPLFTDFYRPNSFDSFDAELLSFILRDSLSSTMEFVTGLMMLLILFFCSCEILKLFSKNLRSEQSFVTMLIEYFKLLYPFVLKLVSIMILVPPRHRQNLVTDFIVH